MQKTTNSKRAKLHSFFTLLGQAPKFSFSAHTFGQFQYQNEIQTNNASFSAYKTRSGGVSIELDYLGSENMLLGGAATYILHASCGNTKLGMQNTQSVYATAFAGWIFNSLTFNFLVTADYNRTHGVRNFPAIPGASITIPGVSLTFQTPGLPGGTAYSVYNSYQLAPHFDINYEIGFGSTLSLLPFLASDLSLPGKLPLLKQAGGVSFLLLVAQAPL